MKILYVSGITIPSKKANSVHIMHMCAAFASLGHDVKLLAHVESDDCYSTYGLEDNFEIIHVERKGVRRVLNRLKMRSYVMRWKPDMIYGRDALGIRLLMNRGAKVSIELHQPLEGLISKNLLRMVFRSRQFSKAVFITKALESYYLKSYPNLSESNCTIMPDAASGWKDSSGNTIRKRISSTIGEDEQCTIGYFGSLYPGKGVEMIVRIASLCPIKSFVIIGGSEEEVNKWKTTNVPSNVLFTGFMKHAEIGSFVVDNIDILLAPFQEKTLGSSGKVNLSKWNSPLKIFEYMSLAMPFVASDLEVLKEVLDNQICCFAQPDDPNDWIQRIEELETDVAKREQLGQSAFKRFQSLYSWTTRAENILDKCS